MSDEDTLEVSPDQITKVSLRIICAMLRANTAHHYTVVDGIPDGAEPVGVFLGDDEDVGIVFDRPVPSSVTLKLLTPFNKFKLNPN